MKLRPVLQQLSPDALESLAKQRLSQVTDIRLPSSVLVDELAESLTSFAYISNNVILRHPPSFAIIYLILNSQDYCLPVENFASRVRDETNRMISLASRQPVFSKPKEYAFYLKILISAWEFDADINPSEANLLRALREELKITLMEHFVIEHHPDIHRFWASESAYETERNHLRNSGILYTVEDCYCIPEEIVFLIRRAWGFDLSIPQFQRLLESLNNDDLKRILESEGLGVSGTSQEKRARIIDNYVLPRTALESLGIENLRTVARGLQCRAAGNKDDLIDGLLDWLDSDEDIKILAEQNTAAIQKEEPIVSEQKELSPDSWRELLRHMTNETLYDLLSKLPDHPRGGNKERRIDTISNSPYGERTILAKLSNETLQELCRQIRINPYGVKEDKVGRILVAYKNYIPPGIIAKPEAFNLDEDENAVRVENASPIPLASQLRLLPSVKIEFEFLDESEQIVLSYLMDFKSMSDPELEKLIQRFRLPWILPKAQMSELVEKLNNNGRNIIDTRALGDHNIYEIIK